MTCVNLKYWSILFFFIEKFNFELTIYSQFSEKCENLQANHRFWLMSINSTYLKGNDFHKFQNYFIFLKSDTVQKYLKY